MKPRVPIRTPQDPRRLAAAAVPVLTMAAAVAVAMAFRLRGADHPVPVPIGIRDDPRGAFVEAAGGATNALFRAVVSRFAVAGCVPVYLVRREAGVELRRTPPAGLEADADPEFHAWPASDEPASAEVCGRWDVLAVRADGGRQRFPLDLGAVRGRLLGRFDPDTDYRFARVMGGTADRSEVTLEVVHIQDRFEVRARREGERLVGRWRNVDGSEEGAWEAVRRPGPTSAVPADAERVDLLGWTAPDGRRTWRPRDRPPGAGWTPDREPLCRVLRLP